jgi:hypothetical protein
LPNLSETFEPMTRDFPDNGNGGGSQLLLEGKEVVVEAIFDTVERRVLSASEIQQFIEG